MIKTIEQAKQVQLQRVAKGKQGHSKAVRTFCKRGLDLKSLNDINKYLKLKFSLPHLDISAKEKDQSKQINVPGAI